MKLNEENVIFLYQDTSMNCCKKTSGGVKFGQSEKQKLLGIVIDWNLRFDEYILSECKKASRKLRLVVRISKIMTNECRRMLMKAVIKSLFGHFPLVWMCCNWSCNNRINYLHERALKIVYNDNVSSFEYLSQRDQSVTIHHGNICLLGIELVQNQKQYF